MKTSECIRLIQANSKLPIQRARMRVKVTVPVAQLEPVKDDILASAEKVEEEQTGEADWEAVRVS